MTENRKRYRENGYIIINVNDNKLIDEVNRDVEKIVSSPDFKTNSKIYSYNDSPRIVESYKHSVACAKLAKHPSVVSMLTELYELVPKPFSTINFLKSTQQPLHSDYAHFGTVPELRLAGTWIALEDIDPNAGPLQVVPGSHKFDIFEYANVMERLPQTLSELKNQYKVYEDWILSFITENNIKAITPQLKKGDCIIWDANMLHGSPDCVDNTLSRKSQVTHWAFSDVEIHYNPNFSTPSKQEYVERKVTYF